MKKLLLQRCYKTAKSVTPLYKIYICCFHNVLQLLQTCNTFVTG